MTTTTTPAKRKKHPPFVRFPTPDDVPPLVAAAGLCVAILKFTRVNSLAEFQAWAADSASENEKFWKQLALLDLDESQQNLLRTYDPVLKLIRVSPSVGIAVCPECCTREVHGTDGKVAFHGWQAVTGAAPPKCRVTAGCPGKPVKAKVPTQVKIERDENGDAIEPGTEPAEAESSFDADFSDPALFDMAAPAAAAAAVLAGHPEEFDERLNVMVEHAISEMAVDIVAGQVAQQQSADPAPASSDDFGSFGDDFDDDFGSGTPDPEDLTDFDFD